MSILSKCDNLLEIDIQVSPVRPKYKTAHNTKCQARRGSYRSVNSVGGRDEEGELHDRAAVPGFSTMPVVSSALLAAALSLFLILIGVVVVKYVRYRWRVHSDSDDGSDDDNEEEEDREAAVGVDMNGEKIALIDQEQRRMQRAEQQPSDGGVFSRLWALLSLPGAVVETKLLPKKYRKRKAKCAPKKFHKPYFYPLLEETAQWWEAQCQLQTIKVDSTSPVLSAPLVPSPPAPSSTIKRVAIASEHHLSYSRQASTNCELFYAADAEPSTLKLTHSLPALPSKFESQASFKSPLRRARAEKKTTTTTTMARERIPLDIGLRLDVLDNEGIWNTGVIVDVAKDDENDDDLVEIKYDGWGDEYNEWVPVSKQRLAPLHMFTIVKKCWAKLNKWPWWPAFVVLRAPTKRGAVEALDAETKVYVEFFDSFEEDKRSRCWMQKKSVVSFDDNFEDRAAKNVGKNFHKFVEHTQRALASGSPLLFAGAGTLPIEYSSKSPLSFVVQKQKVGNKDWFEAFKSFSDRYRVLYGFEVAKNGAGSTVNTANLPTIQRAGEDDEVAEGNGYADEDESEEKDEPEEDEASANEEDDEEEEEEAVESARGRRSARGTKQAQQPKRKLPTRASTRGNASKRVKVIEQLLQDTAYVKGRQQQQQLPSSSQGVKPKPKPRSVGNATAPLSSSSSCRPGEISRSEQNQVPVLLSQEDEGEEEDGNASNGKRRTAKDSASSQPPHSSLLNADVINILELLPISSEQKKSALPLASTATTASTSSMMVSWSEHDDDSQIFVISSEPPTNSTTTTTITTSAFRSSVIMRSSSASPAASKTIKSKSSTFGTPAKNTRSSSSSSSSFHRRKSPRKVSVVGDFGQDQDHVFNTNQKNEDKQDLDSEEDEEDMFRFWNGGSRYEINREPWKIQSWLLHGLKQKLEEPSS